MLGFIFFVLFVKQRQGFTEVSAFEVIGRGNEGVKAPILVLLRFKRLNICMLRASTFSQNCSDIVHILIIIIIFNVTFYHIKL